MTGPFTKRVLIAVEGWDDKAFFRHLASGRDDAEVDQYTGDNLQSELRALAAVSGFARVERVVLVHDADGDRERTLQKVWTHIVNAWKADVGQDAEAVTWDEGAILSPPKEDAWVTGPEGREWKVWLLPETETGDLEAQLWRAAVDAERRDCTEAFLRCLGDPTRFQAIHKTRLMAYLAAGHEPLASITRVTERSSEKSGIDLAHPSLDWLRLRIAEL